MAAVADTLALDGDDTLEVIDALEEIFGIHITDDEASACQTVGDVIALMDAKVPPQADGACHSAMAFYRLRQALLDRASREELRPGSSLVPLTAGNAVAFLKRLEVESGLKMPPPQRRWMTLVGFLLMVGALPAVAVLEHWGLWRLPAALLIVTFGYVLMTRDPGALMLDMRTLGGLSKHVAMLNYGRLVAEGGAGRRTDLQAAVMQIFADVAGISSASVRPDTRILA